MIVLYTFLALLIFSIDKSAADDQKDIIGGTEVEKGRYPYQVVVADRFGLNCGGTLIAEDWVLTAAHCGGTVGVFIGRHNIDGEGDSGLEEIEMEYEIKHPQYSSFTFDNDISLLKLVNASSYTPVKLDDGSENLRPGTDVTVIGWGVTEDGSISDVLREVEVDVWGRFRCSLSYPFTITRNMVCAARKNKDSCQGDSGGALIKKGADAESDVQVGIVSFGNGCARRLYPGVYTRVSQYDSWIKDQMSSDS